MALIIKADMPKGCGWDCDLWSEGLCAPLQKSVDEHTIDSDCPIIGEIPDKHGRLIDADALLPKSGYDPMMFKHKYDGDHRTQYDTLMGYEILGIVEDAPTIVEATE